MSSNPPWYLKAFYGVVGFVVLGACGSSGDSNDSVVDELGKSSNRLSKLGLWVVDAGTFNETWQSGHSVRSPDRFSETTICAKHLGHSKCILSFDAKIATPHKR